MFGESRSESPRLPSPWTEALASSKGIKYTSSSPIVLGLSTSSSAPSSRTPSSLNLSITAGARVVKTSDDEGGDTENETSGGSSSLSLSGSLHSGSVGRGREMSLEGGSYLGRSSQNLILSPEIHGSTKLEAERDKVGHIEYKLKLIAPGPERFERLTTQLKWRLTEGGGEAMYEIGVMDDGTLIGITRPEMEASLRTLELMASELGATVMVLRTITLSSPPPIPASILISSNSMEFSSSLEPKDTPPDPDLERQRIRVEKQKRQKLLRKVGSGLPVVRDELESLRGSDGSNDVPMKRNGHGALSAKNRRRMKLDAGHESESDGNSDEELGKLDEKPMEGLHRSSNTIMPKGKARAIDQDDVVSLGIPGDGSNPASWRERNMIRAQQDHRWRETAERSAHHVQESSTVRPLRPKKNGKFRKKAVRDADGDVEPLALSGDQDEPDDSFIFDIEGITDEKVSPQPLTEAALSAFVSRQTRKERPAIPMPAEGWKDRPPMPKQVKPKPPAEKGEAQKAKLLRKREMKAKKQEARRMDLLRGDGMDSFFGDGERALGDGEDSDVEVKGLVQRVVAPISIGRGTRESSQPRVKLGQLAISPSSTLRPSSPRASLFALHTPSIPPDMAITPSPTETLTLPLDSLSLSFAQAETVVDGGHSSSDESSQRDGGVPLIEKDKAAAQAEERLCVEAIVVKKMDIDERFNFLDFGSAGT